MDEWQLAAEMEEMKYHLQNETPSPLGEGGINIYKIEA